MVMGQASNLRKRVVVSLETLLQQMRLPFVKIEYHLSEQTVRPREPRSSVSECWHR
jgi:hypothetical protein